MRKESKEDKNEIEQLESDISSLAETLCSSKEVNIYSFFLFFFKGIFSLVSLFMSKLLSLDSCCFIEHNVLKEKLELLDKKLCSTKEKVYSMILIFLERL